MSERELTDAVKAEIAKPLVRLAAFGELIFDDGVVRLWTGLGPIVFRGETYTGAGNLVGMSAVVESGGDVKATNIGLTLSGIDKELLAVVALEHFQGRPASVWIAMFDENWHLIPDEILLFKGKMDYPIFEKTGQTMSITVFVESQLIDLERPRLRRRTDADQQELYPGDTGLRFVAGLQDKNVVWQSA